MSRYFYQRVFKFNTLPELIINNIIPDQFLITSESDKDINYIEYAQKGNGQHDNEKEKRNNFHGENIKDYGKIVNDQHKVFLV